MMKNTSLHSLFFYYFRTNIATDMKYRLFNLFQTNVPLMGKPGGGFLLTRCVKHSCGRVTFYVKMQVMAT